MTDDSKSREIQMRRGGGQRYPHSSPATIFRRGDPIVLEASLAKIAPPNNWLINCNLLVS